RDWSSDVCSSDLPGGDDHLGHHDGLAEAGGRLQNDAPVALAKGETQRRDRLLLVVAKFARRDRRKEVQHQSDLPCFFPLAWESWLGLLRTFLSSERGCRSGPGTGVPVSPGFFVPDRALAIGAPTSPYWVEALPACPTRRRVLIRPAAARLRMAVRARRSLTPAWVPMVSIDG